MRDTAINRKLSASKETRRPPQEQEQHSARRVAKPLFAKCERTAARAGLHVFCALVAMYLTHKCADGAQTKQQTAAQRASARLTALEELALAVHVLDIELVLFQIKKRSRSHCWKFDLCVGEMRVGAFNKQPEMLHIKCFGAGCYWR